MTDHIHSERFTLTSLDPTEIVVESRLVPLREEHVLSLAEHIERSRYIQPVLAVKLQVPVNGARYRLVAGRHRLEAARLLGWSLPALVAPEASLAEGEEQLLEALENAGRLVLSHAQRVRHEQIILQHYEQRLGRPLTRRERADQVKAVARRHNVVERTGHTILTRAVELSPAVLDAARGTPLDTYQGLATLASMADDEARLRRIERERQTAQAPAPDPDQDPQRQAARLIRAVLERGLGRSEIAEIVRVLPSTTLRHLRETLEEAR